MTKYRRWLSFPGLRSVRRGERGLTLIEVLIALGIIATVSTTFLVGMSTSSKYVIVNQEHVNAESLVKSQMEAIKRWDYDDTGIPPNYEAAKLTDITTGYDINIAAERLEADPDNPPGEDDGLQQITVTITRGGRTVLTLEGYKCLF